VELTKPYLFPILKIPSGSINQYQPTPIQQQVTEYNYMYPSPASLDNDYLSSDEDIPYFDYYEYGGPPDYGGGGGGWYGPFPPPPPPPSGGTNNKPVKGKPKPKPPGTSSSSGVDSPGGSGNGWSEGPPATPTGEGDKEKDKLSQLKDKWNSLIDKFKLKDKDKDKDKVKGKEPENKPPQPPPTQGSGWGNNNNNNNSGWGQPHPPPSWLGPSNGGGGGGKPILEIWLGPLWGDDPSNEQEVTTISTISKEETTPTLFMQNSNVTSNNVVLPSSTSVLK